MPLIRFACTALCALLVSVALPASALQKHPDDKSVSRTLTLDNGLRVLLVSDPAFNNSAASLDVQVGSLSDPRNRQGLAHFLEHMLFLGTEKYPDVDEYSKYLQRNGGRSNAFTSGENTNYHFAVRHEAYEGALDRFAQFFIGPLFTKKYTEREVKAVQSEHKKNLMNDGWRFHMLIRRFFKPEHAANHFGTGSDKTLAGVTDDELRAFYNKFYSANVMSLCMLSNQSLDAMEAMAREKFSAIKNKNLTPPKFEPDFMPQKNTFRLVEREPIKDLKELSLSFGIPGLNQWYRSKPASLLGHCIGHEGKGSLLSHLKTEGLATGLSAGGWSEAPDFGRFSISVQLTDKGVERYQDVVAACFSYISILRESGVPDYAFDESKAMAELDYTYSDKGEGTGRAIHLASNVNAYSLETAETANYLYEKRDPSAEKLLLDRLIPENMICVLTAKGRDADKKEAVYGTAYRYTEDTAFFAKLKSPETIATLRLPEANPFIPKQPKLYAEQPVKIIDAAGAVMWYSQDVEFDRPKISMSFRIRTDGDDVSLEQSALLALYTACIEEQLNELAYPALQAGLNYGVSENLDGVSVTVSGYSQSALDLLKNIAGQLDRITLDPTRFKAIRDRKIRGWSNFEQEAAWQVTAHEARQLRRQTVFRPKHQAEIAKSISLRDVRNFAEDLYEKTFIEAIVHGNITAEAAGNALWRLQAELDTKPLDRKHLFQQAILEQPASEAITYDRALPTNNSCFWRTYNVGVSTPEMRAMSGVLGNFVHQPFYSEMRTQQQLGYIVWGGVMEDEDRYFMYFIIQSGDYPADELRVRADKFIHTLPGLLEKMTDEQFAQLKAGFKQELLEKPKSISEKTGIFASLAFRRNGDFERIMDTATAVDKLTKKRVHEVLSAALAKDSRRMVECLSFAEQHEPKKDTDTDIEDIRKFKKKRHYTTKSQLR